MNDWSTWLAIVSGGAAGAVLRGLIFHGVGSVHLGPGDTFWTNHRSTAATLIVNVLGSLILGALLGSQDWATPESSEAATQIFWTTGVCGAMTTFGTLCADVIAMARAGQRIRGGGFLAAHLVLGISAFVLGVVATS